MLHTESTAGDGDVNVRMLVELSTIGVQGAEDTDFHALFTRPPEHGAGGGAKQGVEE